MDIIESTLSQGLVQRLGWTLVHFVWQAGMVALLLAILLKLLCKSSASLRYVVACLALVIVVLLPAITMNLIPVTMSSSAVETEPEPATITSTPVTIERLSNIEAPVVKTQRPVENVTASPMIPLRQRITEVLEPFLPYVVLGWLVGVFGLSIWHLGGWTQLQRLRRRMVKPVDESLRSKLKELAGILGVHRVVQLMESALVQAPIVVGWLKPVILLPVRVLTGFSADQLEAILAHELAHIKRYDYLVNMLQTVLEILGFYHPAVWWVSYKIRIERENCCDDIAVRVSGDSIRYAKTLASFEEIQAGEPELAVAANGGSLFERICRLIRKDSTNSRTGWMSSVIAILLIMGLVIPTTLTLSALSVDKPAVQVESEEEGENSTSDINGKVAKICTGPADFNDVIAIFGQPSDYRWGEQSFKLDDLPVERYWVWYPDSVHIFMRWNQAEMLEIVDSAYVFNGRIPMGSSLERVLSIAGQPKEIVVGRLGWEDGVLYKDINSEVGWCQYRREDLNADFRFLNYSLNIVHIFLESKSPSRKQKSNYDTGSSNSFKTIRPIKSVKEFDDVRWKDMSKLDLSSNTGLPTTLNFNLKTVWPESAKLPARFEPNELLRKAMNPGLGVRKIHKQGITGRGVNVAIIDQPMYLDHPEFAGKIIAYHDVGCGSESSMHGPAVTSLLVGTNCGTAPGARVYYVAAPSWTKDAAFQAEALYWIIEQNEQLPKDKKIQVVSVSAAPSGPGSPFDKHNKMWDRACERAEDAGILVLDCTSHRGFIGACWYDATDPENVAKCTPGFRGRGGWGRPGCILVPTSPRTTAEEYDKGEFAYQYCGRGGLSWAIPYCAGVLALGWQVNPELSSGQMRDLLFKSAYIRDDGMRIINPEGFIQFVKKVKVVSSTQASR